MRMVMVVGVVVSLLLSACSQKCTPSSCDGCCDASGECRVGTEKNVCGAEGNACRSCAGSSSCSSGVCRELGEAESWCTSYRAAWCERGVRCGELASLAICQATLERTEGPCGSTSASRDGRTVVDAAAGTRCLAALADSCGVDTFACDDVVVGTGRANAECFASGECGPGYWCDAATCPGRCRAAIVSGMSAVATQCASRVAYGGLCFEPGAAGVSCAPEANETENAPCARGFFCDAMKKCSPHLRDGYACVIDSACGGENECAGPLGMCGLPARSTTTCGALSPCVVQSFCDSTGSCVPLSSEGAACDASARCHADLFCSTTCQRPRAVGAACDERNVGECGFKLFCSGTGASPVGVCTTKRASGATCVEADECETSCVNGTCSGCSDPTP